MKIWDVCEVHESRARHGLDRCEWAWARLDQPRLPDPCVIVPMRLIPDNEETVDREALAVALGQWSNNPVHFSWEDVIYQAARAYLAFNEETP